MYQVYFSKQAIKSLGKMPKNLSDRIRQKIELVAKDPYGMHNNIIKMKGMACCRLRVGDWRVVYIVDEKLSELQIIKIASRGGVYE